MARLSASAIYIIWTAWKNGGNSVEKAAAETGPDDWDGRRFFKGIGRGFAGALLFALPMFLTMEMWELGFYIDRYRLFLLLLLNIPLLVVLSDRVGFEQTSGWREAFRDACIAYGIGIFSSALFLTAMGVLKLGQPLDEIVGKLAIQAVSASIGALLGRSQLNGDPENAGEDGDDPVEAEKQTYAGELFLMLIGALFLGLNVAPTEEMILLSYKMTLWHALFVVFLSLLVMHGFVYALSFRGGHGEDHDGAFWSPFLRFTLPGYVIAALMSCYALWTFHRLDDVSATQSLMAVVVLSLPAAIGAASARLVL